MPVTSHQLPATIYTDGSCHTQQRTGAWAAIIFIAGNKVVLTGTAIDTTHQRMELTAVIKALEYLQQNESTVKVIRLITDSQYITGLPNRQEKLAAKSFTVKNGNEIQNRDLVVAFFKLLDLFAVELIKVKAHQVKNDTVNYNIEADKLSRSLVRQKVKKI